MKIVDVTVKLGDINFGSTFRLTNDSSVYLKIEKGSLPIHPEIDGPFGYLIIADLTSNSLAYTSCNTRVIPVNHTLTVDSIG